jgi:peptidoglycan/LPS O-acetylase OafA/YrhL
MTAAAPRRAFQTLDGLRGVGAFLVVIRHVPLFGALHVPESFLAVDLFYLVSGFVVSHAYAERLKAGGFFVDFVKTRIIRLYPLYALGLGLGVVSALISIFGDPVGWWTWGKVGEALITGAVLFPMLTGMQANGSSLDGPTWTLLPELVANAVYALFVRWMSVPVLLLIMAVSAAGMIHVEHVEETLDVGYGATELWAAMARVGYSFFAGVLVHRFFGAREHRSDLISWGLVAILAVGLGITVGDDWVNNYELAVVLVGFPLLLIGAACFEPGPRAGKLFSVVGLVSYGVYIIHQPLGNIARSVIKRVPALNDPTGIVSGTLFLAGVVVLAWWLDRAFDAPVRKVLRRWLLPTPAGPGAARFSASPSEQS